MTLGRLVLDTNIVLSALLFHAGSLSWLRAAWREERILPLASRQTASELIRVLAYPKFRLHEDDRENLLADYLPWCETVLVPDPPPDVPQCRDPFDRPFLELALAGRADALMTGDGDLLALAAEFSAPILTPAAVQERLYRGSPAPRRPRGPTGESTSGNALKG